MAKPYQNATAICLGLTLLAIVGVLWGLNALNPLIIMLFILPSVLYEVYRTEGKSTKLASWGLLIVFIAEILFIITGFSFNLAEFLQTGQERIAGYAIPLGDIKVVFPIIIAILSVILFKRTRGRYTKWLAVIIFAGAFAIVYSLDPTIFTSLLRFGVQEGLDQIR